MPGFGGCRETYAYTEMYPQFRDLAEQEGNQAAIREFDEQIAESREHADSFQAMLSKVAKRFAVLTKVEERRHEKMAMCGVRIRL